MAEKEQGIFVILILFIIAVLCLTVFRSKSKATCPNCNQDIKENTTKCPNCEIDLKYSMDQVIQKNRKVFDNLA